MKPVPVILAGGSGTRLWPLSRKALPKQFMPLPGGESLFTTTVGRVADRERFAPSLVVCNEAHRFLAARQLEEAGQEAQGLLLEPVGRNTAPAAALAALHLSRSDPGAMLLVLPSDHYIGDLPAFLTAVSLGVEAASAGNLVTFGIKPTHPETGFGYIKSGGSLENAPGVLRIERFVEKPPREKAETYLTSGEYSWNSGMFLFRAQNFLAELDRHHPAMLSACQAALGKARADGNHLAWESDDFMAIPEGAIDTIVMEKTDRAAVVPLSCEWSDLGSWQALWENSDRDAAGNVLAGEVLAIDSENSYIHGEGRLTVALGVKDLVIVDSEDALLILPMARAQETRDIVARLKTERPQLIEFHRTVHRPWGSYTGIDRGEGFQVKRIEVSPGAKLSTQLHHRRAEHWVVVRGTAEVLVGEDTRRLEENESVYIPVETRHRLVNPGTEPLVVIEVQYGDYLGEDDIVRFEDVYGRV